MAWPVSARRAMANQGGQHKVRFAMIRLDQDRFGGRVSVRSYRF